MSDPKITYFPVGSGDTSLVRLSDETTIVIDLNARQESADPSEPRYDVADHLRREAKRRGGRPYHDVFALSHPDLDHCRGFNDVFHVGPPDKQESGKILIDELWFSPRIFRGHEDELSTDAQDVREEAKRRMKLHRAGSADRNKAGNRLRIIGYTDDPEFEDLDDITTCPGDTVPTINGQAKTDLTIFVHAPFKADTDGDDPCRNGTSMVLRFAFHVDGATDACLTFFGGDADSPVWERIFDHGNALEWDLFLAPHHCSWTFFSEDPCDDDSEPSDKVLGLLDERRQGAWVVSSSRPVRKEGPSPPHHRAAKHYKDRVGEKRFLCTGEHPSEKCRESRFLRLASHSDVGMRRRPRGEGCSRSRPPRACGPVDEGSAVVRVPRAERTHGVEAPAVPLDVDVPHREHEARSVERA